MSMSLSKQRITERGRTRVFCRGWIPKVSLLLLLVVSSVFFAAGEGSCIGPGDGSCFAKDAGELEDKQKDIEINDGKIAWKASPKGATLYHRKPCKKLVEKLSISKRGNQDKECEFSMGYGGCNMDLTWDQNGWLMFHRENKPITGVSTSDDEVNVVLDGDKLILDSAGQSKAEGQNSCAFNPEDPKDGEWCKFDFAFNNKDGDCEGRIQFDKDYKLLATPAPTTTTETTTSITDAHTTYKHSDGPTRVADASFPPWAIVLIVLGVLLLVLVVVGGFVFWIFRRRRAAKAMAEKGNIGSDVESCIPPPKSPIPVDRSYKTESMVSEVSAKDQKEDEPASKPMSQKNKKKKKQQEDGEQSKPTSKIEDSKPISQKKKEDQKLALFRNKNQKKVPSPRAPSPCPPPPPPPPPVKRYVDEGLYEPLGDPVNIIPIHMSEKKMSEKKKKDNHYIRLRDLQGAPKK